MGQTIFCSGPYLVASYRGAISRVIGCHLYSRLNARDFILGTTQRAVAPNVKCRNCGINQ
jgi:hypothetical protein